MTPRDSFRQRVFLEPLGTYIVARTGHIARIELDFARRRVAIELRPRGARDSNAGRPEQGNCLQSLPFTNYVIQVTQAVLSSSKAAIGMICTLCPPRTAPPPMYCERCTCYNLCECTRMLL